MWHHRRLQHQYSTDRAQVFNLDYNQTLIYLVLLLTSIVYAAFLQTEQGRWLCEFRAWMTVAIGVGYTLVAIAFLSPAWDSVAKAFVVAGLPICVRSLYNEWRRER